MGSRSRRIAASAIAAGSVCAAVAVAPAVAWARCPVSSATLNGVKSFNGTASEGYVSGTVVWTPPVEPGGTMVTYTESMDRQAENMKLTNLTQPDEDSGIFASLHAPSGGTVTINDSYSDTLGGVATQTASGPTITGGGGEGVDLSFDTHTCTYDILIPYAIKAPTQANMPGIPADAGVYDQSQTPQEPIPAKLVLKGSATIPASGGGTSGSTGQIYDMSSDPTWPDTLDDYAAQMNLPSDPGTATVSWDLTPTFKPVKKKPVKKKAKLAAEVRSGLALGRLARVPG